MIQLCGKEITLTLQLLLKSMLEEGIFPDDWKKSNVVPVHKTKSTNLIKNYRPISLLPIFSKIFEQLIFNSLFNYFMQNKLFTECQSGFIPGDSCVAQLLSITHEIYKSFDRNPSADTRGIYLDISKTFHKVWHESLIFKLKTYGIDGDLLISLINYLEDHKHRVALNGQISSWKNILAGVPQGSVLGPILFLIYINDLLDGKKSTCKIFADDTSLFSKVKDKNYSTVELNNDLKIISNWAFKWKMLFNLDPNKQALEILFSKKHEKDNYPPLNFNGDNAQTAIGRKHLSLVLDSKVDFTQHISNKINNCNKIIGIMKKLFPFLSRKTLLTIYESFVRPNLDCADIIYDKPFKESFKTKIEMIQYQAAFVITGAIKDTSRDRRYQEIGLESLADRRWSCKIFFFLKIVNGLFPSHLPSYLNRYNDGEYQTKSACQNQMITLTPKVSNY